MKEATVEPEAPKEEAAPEQASAREVKEDNEEPRMLSTSKGHQNLNKVSADGIVVGAGEEDEAARASSKSLRDNEDQEGRRESIDEDDMEEAERRVEILRAMAEGEHNFFYFPYEAQQVLFMMVKGDNEGLAASKLYC